MDNKHTNGMKERHEAPCTHSVTLGAKNWDWEENKFLDLKCLSPCSLFLPPHLNFNDNWTYF